MPSAASWLLITAECIALFCIMMGNFPANTINLYPFYEAKSLGEKHFVELVKNLDAGDLENGDRSANGSSKDDKLSPKMQLPADSSSSFGVWTGRSHYTGDKNKKHNDFDDRINTVRAFHIFGMISVIISIMMLANEMCMNRWDQYEKTPPDAAHAYYRAQYIIMILQFISVLLTAWIYTTIVQIDWIPWPLSLLICGLCLSALGVGFLTAQIVFPPRQDKGNGRIKGLPLIFLVVAVVISVVTLLMSFGCLATFEPPESRIYGEPDVAQTTLSTLTHSFPNAAYRNALYAFFAMELITNILVAVVISVMILMTNENIIRRFTWTVLISTMILYLFSLTCTWILSRAPALLDPAIAGTRHSSAFVIEAIKFFLINALVGFVVAAFVVDPQDADRKQQKLFKPSASKRNDVSPAEIEDDPENEYEEPEY